MKATARNGIPIEVSKDRLRADCIVAGVDPGLLTSENITDSVQALGIELNDDVQGRVAALVESAASGEPLAGPVVLAEGVAPVHGEGAWVEFLEEAEDQGDPDGRTDFYESRIPTVSEGQVIGFYHPATSVRSGTDVYGKPIKGVKPLHSVELGENVTLAEDGRTMLAAISGKLHVTRREVAVVEAVEVAEDVDFSTGNVDAPADVLINGTVRSGFKVCSPKSVAVRGAIESAVVEAGTDIHVTGGIVGQGKAIVQAGGDLFTKFCSDACLEAQGDITITRECMNSRIRAHGFLYVPRGKVVGGSVYARKGAEIKVLGNMSERRTEVAIGLDPEILPRVEAIDEEIRKKRESAAKVREKIGPLIAQIQRLTSEQREQATMLMFQADEVDVQADELENKKKQLTQAAGPDEKVQLLVTAMVHPGVAVIFGDKMTVFRMERKGPISIERRVIERVEEICAVDRCSGSVTVLPSYTYVPSEEPVEAVR